MLMMVSFKVIPSAISPRHKQSGKKSDCLDNVNLSFVLVCLQVPKVFMLGCL